MPYEMDNRSLEYPHMALKDYSNYVKNLIKFLDLDEKTFAMKMGVTPLVVKDWLEGSVPRKSDLEAMRTLRKVKQMEAYGNCYHCIYATMGSYKVPTCMLYGKKIKDCKNFHRPQSIRYDFKYDGYRLIATQVEYYDEMTETKRFTLWLNAYEEPYKKNKHKNPIYIAHLQGYLGEKEKEEIKAMCIDSFETFYIANLGKPNRA